MKLHVGGETTTRVTPIVGARLAFPAPDSGASGVLIVDLQPVPVKNPVLDESISALYLLPSFAFRAGAVVLTGGVGPTAAYWSGTGSYGFGGALGASLNVDLARHTERGWAVELFWRAGAGDEVSARLMGAQVLHYLK